MTLQTPWAILLCRWSDMLKVTKKRNFFEQMFTASGRGTDNMVDFFDVMSHGKIDIGGSQVFGWLTLPKKRSDYTGSGANPQGRHELISWAKQAATDVGINLNNFFNVVICMNATPTLGTDLFGGRGGVVCDTNTLHGSAIGQEMGHGYGLDHSREDGSTVDYRDRWDVMSTWDSCFMQPHPDYVLIGPGLNAANMAGRGWLDESRVWTSGSTSYNTSITLRPLHRPDLPGYLAARLGGYFVEFRLKDRWDAAIPRSAVLIHRFDDNRSYLMSANDGQQDLIAGNTFGDSLPGPFDIFTNFTRLVVDEINEAGRYARINVQHRAVVMNAGPGMLFGGVGEDGGGILVLGGKIIRIPPRSPLIQVLEQVLIHEMSSMASAQVRESLQRGALESIKDIAEQRLQNITELGQPTPLVQIERRSSRKKTRK